MLAEIKINTAVIILTMQTMLLTFAYYNITTGLLQHGYRKKKSNRLRFLVGSFGMRNLFLKTWDFDKLSHRF